MGRPAEGPTECTALYSASHSILAQNWDWDLVAESLTVFMRSERTDTGRKILQICEPGILVRLHTGVLPASGLALDVKFILISPCIFH